MLPKYGHSRLKFPPGEQRKFIEKVFKKSSLNTEGLAKLVNLSPRTISDWRREKFNIDNDSFNIFSKQFNIASTLNKNNLIKEWEKIKLTGSLNGGYKRFKKHGNPATLEGCKKGGSNTLKILREKGIIAPNKNFSHPHQKNSKLAEFVGIMLGDGSLTELQASITLNTEADKDYLKYVKRLGTLLFKDKPTISARKDSKATDLRFSGKKLVEYLIKIGLQTGNKVKNQVEVPKWILNSKSYKVACLRGLMDTDGCVVKSSHVYKLKRYVYYNPCFANRSKPLLQFVGSTLVELGFSPSVAGERIWLYNIADIRNYFQIVGSSNYRLLKFKEDIPIG